MRLLAFMGILGFCAFRVLAQESVVDSAFSFTDFNQKTSGSESVLHEHKARVAVDLLQHRDLEVGPLSSEKVATLNEEEVEKLHSLPITFKEKRFSGISLGLAQKIIDSIFCNWPAPTGRPT